MPRRSGEPLHRIGSRTNAALTRVTVTAFSIAALAAGVLAVAVRLDRSGGGGYSDIFLVLGGFAVVATVWGAVATIQFVRRETTPLHPVGASAIALVALLLLAFAIGLRG